METYYTILGVPETATDEQIKQTYRVLAKKYHPDLHPGDQAAARKFAQINEAMGIIGDPEKRKAYDDKRNAQQKQAEARAAAARAASARAATGAQTAPGGGASAMAGMSQGARQAYANSAAGALQAINDAYRRGYDAGVAATSQQRNVAVDTWKKSAESWQKEAENRRLEIDALRRELNAARHKIEEERAEAEHLETVLRAQIAKARDTRLDVEVEAAAAADLRETLEGKIRELEYTLHDYENKLNVERESRKYSDADKVRLSRELVRMREEITELKEENAALRAKSENTENAGAPAAAAKEDALAAYIGELMQRANDDPAAALVLGEMYLAGEKVPKDASAAVHWFTRGTEDGNADAMYYLGMCYLNGEGVEIDPSRGVMLMKDAAAKGSALAAALMKDVKN